MFSLSFTVKFKSNGTRIRAPPTCSKVRFDRDSRDTACTETNTDGEFIVIIWSRFVWMLSAAVIDENVSLTWSAMAFAYFHERNIW
jgi:hypothetical protein